MSNKIFSWKRFWLYFKQYVHVNYKMWLLASLVSIGIMLIFHFLSLDHLKDARRNYWYFFQRFYTVSCSIFQIGLYGLGLLITVISFNNFSSKKSGIFYLSLPATTFEKLFAHWIITVPVFLIFYQLLYLAVSIIVNYTLVSITGMYLGLYVPVWEDGLSFILNFISIQSFFLAGTVLTGKSSFIKTTLTFLLIVLFSYLYGKSLGPFFLNFNISHEISLHPFSFHSTTLIIISKLASWLLVPVGYMVAYYFLKEKEV